MYNLSPQTPSSSLQSSRLPAALTVLQFVRRPISIPKLAREKTSHHLDRPMMQHNTTMSAAAAKAKRGVISSLQGPRPLPLSLPGTTASSSPPRPAKRLRVANNGGSDDDDVRAPPAAAAAPGPVIVYEHTPKVIHARPDEFKALVQRLTGRQPAAGGGGDQGQEAVLRPTQTAVPPSSQHRNPLVLTLGQQQVPPPPPLPLDDHHHTPPVLPSPPGGAAGFLLSPGSFLFSPASMQAIHELIS